MPYSLTFYHFYPSWGFSVCPLHHQKAQDRLLFDFFVEYISQFLYKIFCSVLKSLLHHCLSGHAILPVRHDSHLQTYYAADGLQEQTVLKCCWPSRSRQVPPSDCHRHLLFDSEGLFLPVHLLLNQALYLILRTNPLKYYSSVSVFQVTNVPDRSDYLISETPHPCLLQGFWKCHLKIGSSYYILVITLI